MLNSWHLKQGGFKALRKLIYWRSVAYPAFRHIPLIHAVTPRERDELAQWFPGQGIEVIPNAIDVEAMDYLGSNPGDNSAPVIDEPYVLFLGRIHPVKGIDLLIQAFAKAIQGIKCKFRLIIAGPSSDPAYTAKLQSLVSLLGIEETGNLPGSGGGATKKTSAFSACLGLLRPLPNRGYGFG